MVETPSSCATVFKLSGLLWYFAVEVREITLRSRTVANLVRISFWMPSAKYAFAFSSLKFSKGKTAILFSGVAGAVEVGPVFAAVAIGLLDCRVRYHPPSVRRRSAPIPAPTNRSLLVRLLDTSPTAPAWVGAS